MAAKERKAAAEMNCINLKERFGDQYRVATDESYQAESGSSTASNRDPWLFILRGSRGHIYPIGGDMLGASIDAPGVAKRAARSPFVDLSRSQVGDGEANIAFPVSEIKAAADWVKLYRKPVYSEETLARKREHGKRLANFSPTDSL